jgi:hypothetical protein
VALKTEPPRRFRMATRPLLLLGAFVHAPTLAVFGYFGAMREARYIVPLILGLASWSALGLLLCRVDVTEDGLTLNLVNALPWAEVEAVTPSSILGLRYLKAYRKGRRWAWWFPLYLADEDGFRRAVIERAPAGNPFRTLFEMEVGLNP